MNAIGNVEVKCCFLHVFLRYWSCPVGEKVVVVFRIVASVKEFFLSATFKFYPTKSLKTGECTFHTLTLIQLN